MAARDPVRLVVGIVAIVLGILVLVGRFGFGDMVGLLGIILVIMGILVLVNIVKGSRLGGVLLLVLGIVLLAGFLPVPELVRGVMQIVVGVLLILVGFMFLRR